MARALVAGMEAGERKAYEKVLRAAASEVLGLEVRDVTDFVRQAGVEGALPLLTDAAREVFPARVREVMTPVLSAIMVASTEGKAPVLGSFTLRNPKMAEFLNSYTSELADNLSSTSYDNARRVIREALDEGLGVDDAAVRLRGRLSELNRSRSELISRTELNNAQRGATHLQVSESGVPMRGKVWRATMDERTRPEHRALNGETVDDIQAPFSNGEVWPSSPRCRCTVEYLPDIEALRGVGA